jgi:hypothetical protein
VAIRDDLADASGGFTDVVETFAATLKERSERGMAKDAGSAYMTDAYRHLLEGHEAEAAKRFED